MFDDGPDGIALLTGQDAGLFSVHMTSDQRISSVMLEVKMILVKDRGIPRGRYYHKVTQYDFDFLGDVLYRELYGPMHRQTRSMVSRSIQ
jgi:hypothetical protein